jgi:uncharacterized glyoxalase superfamily protein PhnB
MTDTGTTSTKVVVSPIWPGLAYHDAPAAIRFLVETFGFTERCRYGSGDVVEHAELGWPGGGVVMIGSVRGKDDEFARNAGVGNTYVVTDDPDGLYERAVAAGAEIFQPLRDEDYGNRVFTVRDPERNLWAFGTYRG